MSPERVVQQAERAKREATENIERKLNVLEAWVRNGIPVVMSTSGHRLIDANERTMVDFFPKSLRQFKAWDGSQNCEATRVALPELRPIGNDTLANRPELERRAILFIAMLRRQSEKRGRADLHNVVIHLQEQLAEEHLLLSARMVDVREQRIEILRLREAIDRIKSTMDGESAEFQRIESQLISENARLLKENATLLKKIADSRSLARI